MTQRHRIELLLMAAVLWGCAVVADRQHLGFVVFAFAVAGIVTAVLTFRPDK